MSFGTTSIKDKQYRILNHSTHQEMIIQPIAVESCMNPGTFRITPIKVMRDEETILYEIGESRTELPLLDVTTGKIEIVEEPFVPKIVRRKNGCNPCTNCGRCSW